MNLSSYEPKTNMNHTISGQGTGISTLDHSATTPRACSSSVSPKHLAHFTHFIMMSSILMLDRKSGTFLLILLKIV